MNFKKISLIILAVFSYTVFSDLPLYSAKYNFESDEISITGIRELVKEGDIYELKFSASNFKRVKLAINLIIMGFAFLGMFIGGLRLVYITLILEQLSPSLNIPLGLVYAVIPLSGILIIFYKVLDLKKQVL